MGKEPAKHILVVNDAPEIVELLVDLLTGEGYRVSTALFVEPDMPAIKADPPDLIILDYIFGGEALGWQLLERLRLDPETADIPVIVCTAALESVRQIADDLRAKGVGLVYKPFDLDDLLTEIDRVWERLARRRADGEDKRGNGERG